MEPISGFSIRSPAVSDPTVFSQTAMTTGDQEYLSWNTKTIDSISKRFRVNGQVGGSFDFRAIRMERSFNYKLRATWFTPEMVRASARYWQLRERLSAVQTQTLVADAEAAGDTVIMVELDPREGSGVIPSDWIAVLRAKGSAIEVKGFVSPALRSAKAFAGTVQRDYAYDIFRVVFSLFDEKGQALFPDTAAEAELAIAIYNKQGKVTWRIPESIRRKLRTVSATTDCCRRSNMR